MKFKVFVILLFSCSKLVGSIPYYDIQPTSHLGDYPNPSLSQEGITSEQWPSNLARSQNTNLRSGPAFAELPSNNFQSPLGSKRPLEVSHPNYNYHQQNLASQGPVPSESYTNPISESYLPVQQEHYGNIHTIQASRTGKNEPLQIIPQSFVPSHPQNYENFQNVHESYETPVRSENFNNMGNKHTIQESIQNGRTQSTDLYRNIATVPHSYNNENLHSIRAIPKESYKIENLEPISPITYKSIGNEEKFNQIQEAYLRHNEPHQIVRVPQESYTVPLQHTYKNIPEVRKVNAVEEPLTYNLFNYGEHPLKQLISNPKIKEIIQSTKNKKRFMVIHNDGTVEHTDILSPAVTTNPNYVLLSGGKVVPKEILPAIIGPSYSPPSGFKPNVAPKSPDCIEPFSPVEDLVAKSPHSGAIKSPANAFAPSLKLPTITDETQTEQNPLSSIDNLIKLEGDGSNPSYSTKPNPTPIETIKELLNKMNHKAPDNENTENKPIKQELPTNTSEILLNEITAIKPVNKNNNNKTNNNPENCDSSQPIAPKHPPAINPVDKVLNVHKKNNNKTNNNPENCDSSQPIVPKHPTAINPVDIILNIHKNNNNKTNNNPENCDSSQPIAPKHPTAINPVDKDLNETETTNNNATMTTTNNQKNLSYDTLEISPSTPVQDEEKNKDDNPSTNVTESTRPSHVILHKKDSSMNSTIPSKQPPSDNKTTQNEPLLSQPENIPTKNPNSLKQSTKPAVDENEDNDEDDEDDEKDEQDEDEKPKEKKFKPTARVKPDKNGKPKVENTNSSSNENIPDESLDEEAGKSEEQDEDNDDDDDYEDDN